MKFEMVETMVREDISVQLSCEVLGISRSGYYAWQIRPESERKMNNDALIVELKNIHKESKGTYGLPRLQGCLKTKGISCGKSRIRALMKKAEISGLIQRRFKVRTTDSNHDNPIAQRIFKTEEPATHPRKPNEVWASDISFIPTDEGFLYLATYLDLYTKKVVGFSTDESMKTELILSALHMAIGRQNVGSGQLLNHSDRGVQYASRGYRRVLNNLGINISMSRKGNCWDNAFAESFFATIKKELIYRNHYKTKEEAKKSIFEYIEVWYNRKRIHSSIGYMTPVH